MALLTLFEISTTEAWTSVTYAAVDSTSVDMQPIRDYILPRVWFFILFMLVGAYLVLNLFVGVVVDNFKKVRALVTVFRVFRVFRVFGVAQVLVVVSKERIRVRTEGGEIIVRKCGWNPCSCGFLIGWHGQEARGSMTTLAPPLPGAA